MTFPTFNSLSVWCLENPDFPRKVGAVSLAPGMKRLSFKYDAEWIETGFDLSPDMPRFERKKPNSGDILAPNGKSAPGALDDAMPDRWGQTIIRVVDNPPRLTPLDFLYFAGDRRFGCLGVSIERDQYVPYFLPPLPRRESLAAAADLFEKILSRQGVDERERLLLASSRTMGGARPKMLVEIDGHEWIAKFPQGDVVDMPLVEHATMKLAVQMGIQAAETMVHNIGVGHVLLVKRFDREGDRRIHVLSAQSILAKTSRPSYVGMAEALRAKAPPGEMNERRREVFARLAFNVLMDNTDDHDKNHAFVRMEGDRWTLSKAYDLLPQMNGAGVHGMPVGRKKGATPFLTAVANHAEFGLSRDAAVEEWLRVAGWIGRWREIFSGFGVSGQDIEYLSQYIDAPEKIAMRERSISDALPAA